ncbi:EAL domain-containing protein [Pontibacterium granulatum]|uniref:EAL domain-containing protein n=1 Tax=Pontibacterium granulatum TaxID=2036029 RepID=UPI00249A0B73|nr:EAL domain-containing protein [Pontibacterium granulatum]MDI3324455.1 EAL domain-containing protein [Pontibacterium granulatum]
MQLLKKRADLFILIISVVFGAAIFLGLFLLISAEATEKQKTSASRVLTMIEGVFDDAVMALDFLNTESYSSCTNITLLRMRQAVFRSQLIKDVGYFEGENLVCTTGMGVLPAPFFGSDPTFKAKAFDVWVEHGLILFDEAYQAILLKKGDFNAVIRPEDLESDIPSEYQWEISLFGNSTYYHLLGQKQLITDVDATLSKPLSMVRDYKSCSATHPVCIASRLTPGQFIRLYESSIALISALSFLLSLCLFALLNRALTRYLSLSARVQRGFHSGSFYAEFQPIVDLNSGRVIGCEALARYRDSSGPLFPDQFLPVIKQQGMTWAFTSFMLRDVAARLQSIGSLPDHFRVSVNLFPQDITAQNVNCLIKSDYFRGMNVQPILEIIEDAELHDTEFRSLFQTLVDAGYLIAIDDFGTGYSSLVQLKKTNCHILKMDRSFVTDIEEGSIRSSLVPHIVAIAEELDAVIVAEGIENDMQHQALKEAGIRFGQGWAFGKPMPEAQLKQALQGQTETSDVQETETC